MGTIEENDAVRKEMKSRIARISMSGELELARRCAAHCRVTIEEMLGQTRATSAFRARRLFAGALHLRAKMSSKEIGRLVGRDHTTVLSMLSHTSVREICEVDSSAVELQWESIVDDGNAPADLCSSRYQ